MNALQHDDFLFMRKNTIWCNLIHCKTKKRTITGRLIEKKKNNESALMSELIQMIWLTEKSRMPLTSRPHNGLNPIWQPGVGTRRRSAAHREQRWLWKCPIHYWCSSDVTHAKHADDVTDRKPLCVMHKLKKENRAHLCKYDLVCGLVWSCKWHKSTGEL